MYCEHSTLRDVYQAYDESASSHPVLMLTSPLTFILNSSDTQYYFRLTYSSTTFPCNTVAEGSFVQTISRIKARDPMYQYTTVHESPHQT